MTKKQLPQIIVYGLDSAGKAQAGRFAEPQSHTAREAARALNLSAYEVNDGLEEIAKTVPMGRLHARGKTFVPYVKRELYDKLVAAIAKPAEKQDDKPPISPLTQSLDAANAALAAALPRDWEAIEAGHLVLLQESLEAGWYEAVVLARNNESLSLRLRDYPKYPTFVRNIRAVALVHPGLS